MKTRRDFLKLTGLASAAICYPQLFSSFSQRGFEGKRLVVIQLSGGNDGLNCLIPYRNDIYYKSRPQLSIEPSNSLILTNELALHPALKSFREFYSNGELAILNGVGYPEPNRSHFRSMDIWHSASGSDEFLNDGWLGRWAENQSLPVPAIDVNGSLSLALKAEKSNALAISNVQSLRRTNKDKLIQAVSTAEHDHTHEIASYLYQTTRKLQQGADYLLEKIDQRSEGSKSEYPKNKLSGDLKLISQLIKSGAETKVYYASLAGFDTHVNQKYLHSRLLNSLSESIFAFASDLRKENMWKDTLILVFSEFGRRVSQNAGGGTDHGTANNVWLLSGGLKNPGIRNEMPSLIDLDRGDLIHTVDFRNIYAGILQNWLKTDYKKVLSGEFNPIAI